MAKQRFKLVFAGMFALTLAGCGAGGWLQQETGLTPAQQTGIIVGAAKAVPCLVADIGGFNNVVVQKASAAACQFEGGTVMVQ